MRLDRRTRTGAIVGAVAAFLALNVAFLISVAGAPFAPAALGQAVIEVLPGWISIPLIELLEFWAQRLLVLGVLAAFLVVGALAGALASDPRRRDGLVVAVGAAPWVGTVVLSQLFASQKIDLAGSLIDAGIGGAAYFATLAFLQGSAYEAVSDGVAVPSRRRALVGALGVLGAFAVGAMTLGGRARALAPRPEPVSATARRLVFAETVAPGEPAFERVAQLTPRLTANRDHYTVDTALIDPRVDPRTWRLEVGGAVERPFALTYDELLDLDAVEQLHTLECISNEIGGDLVSTALWTGVPLPDLLARAVPAAGAYDVVLRSVDGYTDSIRLAKALEPKTIVAYLMNGEVVPEEHGFPARLLVPNIYGMKNVKWLAKIEVVPSDFLGYWMERGWSDLAVVNTHSRIDTPRGELAWNGEVIQIAGIANAGSRGIGRVEVSTDAGRSWTDALIERPLGPLTWVRWRYEWRPDGTGHFKVLARATDGEGQPQTATERGSFPSGSTGYDAADVNLRRA